MVKDASEGAMQCGGEKTEKEVRKVLSQTKQTNNQETEGKNRKRVVQKDLEETRKQNKGS